MTRRSSTTTAALAAMMVAVAACGGEGATGDSLPDARIGSEVTSPVIGEDRAGPTVGGDPFDADKGAGIELASTPEFCAAAAELIGSMETVGVADLARPEEVRLAYQATSDGLDAVADTAPNAGVANQIAEADALFQPLVLLLEEAGWDLASVDRATAGELEALSESSGPRLAALTDEFEGYVAGECGIDVGTARADGVDRFYETLAGAAVVTVDAGRPGERGGQEFCDTDRRWWTAIDAVDRAGTDDEFVDALLASADVYTTWGERLPVELAVATVDMHVSYAETIATYGETQDVAASRTAYRAWRSSAEFTAARAEIDAWLARSC